MAQNKENKSMDHKSPEADPECTGIQNIIKVEFKINDKKIQ